MTATIPYGSLIANHPAAPGGVVLPRIALKRLKLAGGEETRRFEAELWVDGARVAIVSNEGTGGCHRYSDYLAERKVNDSLKGLPKADLGGGLLVDIDCDLLVDVVITRIETEKRIRRACRTKTLYRLVDTPADAWLEMRASYDVRVAAHLRQKHGARLLEILNDRFEVAGSGVRP